MASINFQLVTPEKTVLTKELVSLSCPTTLGQITILPDHAPLVATLVPGELHAKTEKDEFFLYVAGGFVEVHPIRSPQRSVGADAQTHQTSNGVKPATKVIVLADAAEHHHEIDIQRAEEAKKRAEAALKEIKISDEEYAATAASLERSLARMRIQRKHAHRKAPITGEGVFNE